MEFSQQNWSSIGVLVADLVYVGRVSGELETLVDTGGTVLVVSIGLWYW